MSIRIDHFDFPAAPRTGSLRQAAGLQHYHYIEWDAAMAAKTNFRGSFTALVTPFKNGSVDAQMFRDLVEWQIAERTNGLVPVGTTGESPPLPHDEHNKDVEWCVGQAKGRVPVTAGPGP